MSNIRLGTMNFFTRKKKEVSFVKEQVEHLQETTTLSKVEIQKSIVEQIHKEFDTSVDTLLLEEIKIDKEELDKHNLLKQLGFVSTTHVLDTSERVKKASEINSLRSRVKYFAQHYPNNKFITEAVVAAICKKYELILGNAAQYRGSIPDKNIREIRDFKLRIEDHIQHRNGWHEVVYGQNYCTSYRETYEKKPNSRWGYTALIEVGGMNGFGSGRYSFMEGVEGEGYQYEKAGFKICAPKKDMQLGARERIAADGYTIEVYDPVVLQPVSGGYLIVSKWGAEASDEKLLNENHN